MSERFSNNHTISLFVANKPGVLLRIALIFSRRGFNIESLVVSSALDGKFSRMTITAKGEKNGIEQIVKQAKKLVDVVHASEHAQLDAVQREFAMIKVGIADNRTDLLQVVEHFKAETLDLQSDSLIIQVTGATEKVDAMVSMLEPYGIIELVRTGRVLMARGNEMT